MIKMMKKKTITALFLGEIFRKWREAAVEEPPSQVSLEEKMSLICRRNLESHNGTFDT